MTDLRDFLNKYVNVNLRRVIVSNARKKDGISKIQVRPIQMKNGIFYQVTRTLGPKEIHENYEKEALVSYLCCQMTENFRQLQLESRTVQGTVLVSKKGSMRITVKRTKREEGPGVSAYAFTQQDEELCTERGNSRALAFGPWGYEPGGKGEKFQI